MMHSKIDILVKLRDGVKWIPMPFVQVNYRNLRFVYFTVTLFILLAICTTAFFCVKSYNQIACYHSISSQNNK